MSWIYQENEILKIHKVFKWYFLEGFQTWTVILICAVAIIMFPFEISIIMLKIPKYVFFKRNYYYTQKLNKTKKKTIR